MAPRDRRLRAKCEGQQLFLWVGGAGRYILYISKTFALFLRVGAECSTNATHRMWLDHVGRAGGRRLADSDTGPDTGPVGLTLYPLKYA